MYQHDDIMRRAATRSERRLAYLEARLELQHRINIVLIIVAGAASGMALAGWLLYF